ncbi:MAG: molybdenum cofactor guanylyltransferase [Candidatus Acidiferrales bacterium]
MKTVKQVAGFVLAGGESSRMGRDKGLLELDGVPLAVRAAKLAESVTGAPATIIGGAAYESFGLRVIGDDWPGLGPLGGIATALRASETPWNLVAACDLPYLTKEWLEFLIGRALASHADALLPMNERGAEPLCAMYRKRCEPMIRAALERGTRKVTDGLAGLRVESIEPAEWKVFDSEGLLFKNMNSPADYEEAKARLDGRSRR